MTNSEFNQLKYGNVIQEQSTGRRLLVLHVKKGPSGAVTEVGVIDSLNITSASNLQTLDVTAEETIVVNGILQSKTI
jgi:hypothetical protein